MASCTWIEPRTLRLETAQGVHDIRVDQIVPRSPNHVLLVSCDDVIQAELLFGLNEILVQYKHAGYQCAPNDHVKAALLPHTTTL